MSGTNGTLEKVRPKSNATARNVYLSRSGRNLVLRSDGESDCVLVCAPDGAVELTIKLTAAGPVITLGSAGILELTTPGDVAVHCDRFLVAARSGVAVDSGGDISQRAEGDARLDAQGRVQLEARSVGVSAKLGNVDVRANDDVVIDGERIYLNR